MKLGEKVRAALPKSDHAEELAGALDALEKQVDTLAQIIAQGAESVTLETFEPLPAAEEGDVIYSTVRELGPEL